MARPDFTDSVNALSTLRERAENLLRATSDDVAEMAPEDVQRLIHELRVHQIELDLQNEALRDAEADLAESRDRYCDLFEFAPIGYLVLEPNGQISEANIATSTLLGVERHLLVGVKVSHFVCRDSQDTFFLHWQAMLNSECIQSCELGMRSVDGSRLEVRMESCASVRRGERLCRTTLLDLTKTKRAEDTLLTQTRELELMAKAVASLGEGVLITSDDLDWPGPKIVFVNQAMCRITGYTAGELTGQTPRILQGEATDGAILARIRAELEAHRSCEAELINYRKDGTPYHAQLFITPLFNVEDQRTNFVSVHRDITARKEAEEALRREHEFTENIIQTAQIIVLILDREGRVLRFNPYFERLSGWSLEEAKGRDWFTTFLPTRERHNIAALFKKALGSDRTRGKINPIVTREGQERLIEWYDAPLTDHDGALIGLICTGTDITERRRLEHEVIRAAEEERQRIAQDLHDDLGALLTGIKLHSEALGTSLAERGSCELERSNSISRLVRDAITKTRHIAHGLHPVGSDPEDLVSALQRMCERANSTTEVDCRLLCPQPIPIADPMVAHHLFRIAQEAVNNALKHSGGTRITISLKGSGNALRLKIMDNGSAFDPEADRRGGLGLHIMNYRAHAVNASLRVGPRKKGGTEVVCSLPLPAPPDRTE